MMEPLESRRLLSGAVAPLDATSATPNDPNITLTLNGKPLTSTDVLNFGPVGQRGQPVKKRISLSDANGGLPDSLEISQVTPPGGFSLSTKNGADAEHATLIITLTPGAAGTSGPETITIPVTDGSNITLTVTSKVTATPPAQNLSEDPFIVLSQNGQRLTKDFTLAFGQVAVDSGPYTKTISLFDSQGSFPLNFFSLNFGGAATPAGYSVSTALGADSAHATMTVTFSPHTVGAAGGTIALPVFDGGNFVIAFNVGGTVLPTAATTVTRVVMGRLPKIAGNSFRIGGVPQNGLAHVQLTNQDPTNAESGTVNVVLYATTAAMLDTSNALVLGTGSGTLTIKATRSKSIRVRIKFPVLQESANYNIFAVATGPSLITNNTFTYQSPILQFIAAPEINLSGLATQSPAFLVKKTSRVSVPIVNSGNVRAQAGLQLDIYTVAPSSEPDTTSLPSLLGTFNLNYSIDPNREAIRTLNLGQSVPAGFEIMAILTAVRLPAANAAIDKTVLPSDSFAVR
jgi:hypothetical protein